MGTISSPGGFLRGKGRWKHNACTQVQHPWARKSYWEGPHTCLFGIVPSWTWHPRFHIYDTQFTLCSYRFIFSLHINSPFLLQHPFSQLIHIHKLIASCYKTFHTPPLNKGQENVSEIIPASNCSQPCALSHNTYFPRFWYFVPCRGLYNSLLASQIQKTVVIHININFSHLIQARTVSFLTPKESGW